MSHTKSFFRKGGCFFLLCFLVVPSLACADMVQLNSGKIIEGEIIERTTEYLKIDPGFGIAVTYYFDEIESINGELVSAQQIVPKEIEPKKTELEVKSEFAPEVKKPPEIITETKPQPPLNNSTGMEEQEKQTNTEDMAKTIETAEPEPLEQAVQREIKAMVAQLPVGISKKDQSKTPVPYKIPIPPEPSDMDNTFDEKKSEFPSKPPGELSAVTKTEPEQTQSRSKVETLAPIAMNGIKSNDEADQGELKPDQPVELIETIQSVSLDEIVGTKKTEAPKAVKKDLEPLKDITVIEDRSRVNERPSPFGPTIRQNEAVPQSVTVDTAEIAPETEPYPLHIKMLNWFQKIDKNIARRIKNISDNNETLHKKLSHIENKLYEIPPKVRRDILLVSGILLMFLYILICLPMMIIAKKIGKRHIWLAWIPVVQLFYLVYMGNKAPWMGLLYFVPIINIIFVISVIVALLKALNKSKWHLLFLLIPGICLIDLWYLAIARVHR